MLDLVTRNLKHFRPLVGGFAVVIVGIGQQQTRTLGGFDQPLPRLGHLHAQRRHARGARAGAGALRHTAVIGVELAPAEILLAPPHRHQPGEHGAAKTVGLVETKRKQRQQLLARRLCQHRSLLMLTELLPARALRGIDPRVFIPGLQIQLRQRIIAAQRIGRHQPPQHKAGALLLAVIRRVIGKTGALAHQRCRHQVITLMRRLIQLERQFDTDHWRVADGGLRQQATTDAKPRQCFGL